MYHPRLDRKEREGGRNEKPQVFQGNVRTRGLSCVRVCVSVDFS